MGFVGREWELANRAAEGRGFLWGRLCSPTASDMRCARDMSFGRDMRCARDMHFVRDMLVPLSRANTVRPYTGSLYFGNLRLCSQTPRRARLRRSPRAGGAQTRACIAVTANENSPIPHKKRKHVVRTSFRGYQYLVWGSFGGARGVFFKRPLEKTASPTKIRVLKSRPLQCLRWKRGRRRRR